MSANQILIQFSSLHLLWQFAQRIQCISMEINTQHKTLLCTCSEQDLELLPIYNGKVVKVVAGNTVQR
jgi:hypothetical protein